MRLKTWYLAKDQRKVKDTYRKRYDAIKWNKTSPPTEKSSKVEIVPLASRPPLGAFMEHIDRVQSEIQRVSGISRELV